jgi:hypothetical protein
MVFYPFRGFLEKTINILCCRATDYPERTSGGEVGKTELVILGDCQRPISKKNPEVLKIPKNRLFLP